MKKILLSSALFLMGFPLVFSQNQTLQLSVARAYLGVTTFENKIICAGGALINDGNSSQTKYSNIINIIDSRTLKTQELKFPVEQAGLDLLSWNKKLLFYNSIFQTFGSVTRIDIYDFENNKWLVKYLSTYYPKVSAVLIENKVFFFNGELNYNLPMKNFEVYDLEKNQWSYIPIPNPRNDIICYSLDKKLYLIGGENPISKADLTQIKSKQVDIYDSTKGTWETGDPLQSPKSKRSQNSVLMGTKVVFPDGEIYDLTKKKSVSPPNAIGSNYYSAVALSGIAYFTGKEMWLSSAQPTDSIRTYDSNSNTWSYILLPQKRCKVAVFGFDDKIYFAGGFTENFPGATNVTDAIDIYNYKMGKWTKQILFEPRALIEPLVIGDKAFLVGGNRSFADLFKGKYPISFSNPSPTIDILELSTLDPSVKDQLEVFPNPFNSEITFRWSRKNDVSGTLKIYNIIGQEVYNSPIENRQKIVNISHLATGTYVAYLETLSGIFTHKIVKY